MTFNLSEVVPWGRSFDEYVGMFSLSDADLGARILGCGDGPASFNAELTRRNGHVISCDPVYRFTAAEIQARIEETAAAIGQQLAENRAEFVWRHFDSVDEVVATRMRAMNAFMNDFPNGRRVGRYIDASLPQLPFDDDAFDLALCSHFLFLYSEQHDLAFHMDSLVELSRVAAEVRVFPLLELGSAQSRHLLPVVRALTKRGLAAEIVRVDYEFQRGGNRMLVIDGATASSQ